MAGVTELAFHRLNIDPQGAVYTDPLVDALFDEQSHRLQDLDTDPTFAIVQSRAPEADDPHVQARNAANDSYARQLVAYGERLGVDVGHDVYESDFAAANRIRHINRADLQEGRLTPILPLLPGQTPDGSRYITEVMEAPKDPDSTVPEGGLYVPATAEAMLMTAEAMVGVRVDDWAAKDLVVGYIGYGGRTIEPLDQRLISGKAEVAVTLATREEIENIDAYTEALRVCDVIFTGVPKAHVLRARHISEGAAIVDVGQGPHPKTGRPASNVSEDVFAVTGIRATRLRHGVGPVTTAVIYDRVIGMHEDIQHDPSPQMAGAAAYASPAVHAMVA